MPTGFYIALASGFALAFLSVVVANLVIRTRKKQQDLLLNDCCELDIENTAREPMTSRFMEVDFGEMGPAHKARRLHS